MVGSHIVGVGSSVCLTGSGLTFIPNGSYTLSGAIADGNSLTLTGSGFGAVGPTLLYYKNFKNENVGSQVANGADFAASGVTSAANGNGFPYVIGGTGLPYGKAMITSLDSRLGSESSGAYGGIDISLPSQISEVFTSSTVYFPSTCNYTPIVGSAGNPQVKQDWIFCNKAGGGGFNDTDFWTGIDNPNIGIEYSLQSNAAPWGQLDFGTNTQWVWGSGPYPKTNVPIRASRYVQINAAAGSGTGNLLWIGVWDGTTNTINTNNNGQIMVASGSIYNGYQLMNVPGFVQFGGVNPQWSVSNNAYFAESEIIIAGPSSGNSGSAARVEIGDASTYATCSRLSYCPVTSPSNWGSGSITFNLQAGTFYQSLVNAYVYVTTAANVTTQVGQIV